MDKKIEKIVNDVTEDYERRKADRLFTESAWRLNLNFVKGNQFCDIAPDGEITEEDKKFYWQSRRVFNHIAPVVDARLAKLTKMRHAINVRPASNEEKDIYTAKLADGIINAVRENCNLEEVFSRGTMWSEICGTAFYKIVWNGNFGMPVGECEDGKIYEGDVEMIPLSPFEIYPDNLSAESMKDLNSIIHAKAMTCEKIKEIYGVEVKGRRAEEISPYEEASGEDYEVVIERYTKPCKKYPDGRLETVAGGKLLYSGDLPYENGKYKTRDFPFVMQKCIEIPGKFFGGSIVERLIPVQKAYNAVRNRKHEFMNRLSMGVVTVEDGSTDTDELEEGGLCPGKILVYRQGATPPKIMESGSIPPEFSAEEKTLDEEFLQIGETNEISRNSTNPTNVTSATGLQILLDQYDERLTATAKSMDRALIETGRHILRLYRQFAVGERLVRLTGNGKKTQIFYFSASDIEADDIILECDEKYSPSKIRSEINELIKLGILTDENGKIKEAYKNKVLQALGFASLEVVQDLSVLHENKAHDENIELLKGEVERDEYDDDEIHITEHTRFLLSDEFKKDEKEVKERFIRHLREHKNANIKNKDKGD